MHEMVGSMHHAVLAIHGSLHRAHLPTSFRDVIRTTTLLDRQLASCRWHGAPTTVWSLQITVQKMDARSLNDGSLRGQAQGAIVGSCIPRRRSTGSASAPGRGWLLSGLLNVRARAQDRHAEEYEPWRRAHRALGSRFVAGWLYCTRVSAGDLWQSTRYPATCSSTSATWPGGAMRWWTHLLFDNDTGPDDANHSRTRVRHGRSTVRAGKCRHRDLRRRQHTRRSDCRSRPSCAVGGLPLVSLA